MPMDLLPGLLPGLVLAALGLAGALWALAQGRALASALARQTAELEATHARSAEIAATRDELKAALETLRTTQAETAATATRLHAELEASRAEGAAAAARHATALEQTATEARALRNRLETAQAETAALSRDRITLEAELKALRDQHATLRAEIEANRTQFVNQFRAISQDLLTRQAQATTETQKTELEKLLGPFRTEVATLRTGLREMTDKAIEDRAKLSTEIAVMQDRAAQLTQEANSLVQALRGNSKTQGDWGETVLERVLQAAGLIEGTHYTRQAQTSDAEGRRMIPDVVVHLPEDRNLVIDSKVTLTAWYDLANAADKPTHEAAAKRHLGSVQAHIKALAAKDYGGLGISGLDSVLMFLPVEGALTAALSLDPDLVIRAAEQRVHLMTPATLMPILKIVDHLWTIDARNRNVEDIVDRAGRLHDKFVQVVEDVQAIGTHLDKAQKAQTDALARMSTGRGNAIGQVDTLRRLGAKARKALPRDLVDPDDTPEDQSADNSS